MNLPTDFCKKYQALLGTDSAAFLASFQEPAAKGFRLNPKKVSAQPGLRTTLTAADQPIPWSPWGYYGQIAGENIQQLAGNLYSQEPSAQAVAALADPAPGSRVLDLCAAPGGKTTQLAGILDETGLLVANEIDRQRAKVLSENVERFGYRNVVVTNYAPDQLARLLPHFFDVIVVDAPCSGEGMFRKDPQAMQYWSLDYPRQCQVRQRQILTSTLALLAPGGTLVYSTCTFAPEEDEQNVAWLLQQQPTFQVEAPTGAGWSQAAPGRPEWADQNPALAKTVRFWPQSVHGEGHFMAKLVQPASTESAVATSAAPSPVKKQHKHGGKRGRSATKSGADQPSQEQLQLWQQFSQATLRTAPEETPARTMIAQGDQLFLLPTSLTTQPQLRYVRRGLWLGECRKNRFVPNHALLMSTGADDFVQRLDLTSDQFEHFRHGETLQVSPELPAGWYAICYQAQPFSWGYLTQQTMKNFYPKNLRR